MSTTQERVAAGAALLDAEQPGWWQRIDLHSLAMWDGCRCVVGQLYEGEYRDGLIDLSVPVDDGEEEDEEGLIAVDRLGFDGHDIDALQAEWKRLIGERQAAMHAAMRDERRGGAS